MQLDTIPENLIQISLKLAKNQPYQNQQELINNSFVFVQPKINQLAQKLSQNKNSQLTQQQVINIYELLIKEQLEKELNKKRC